MRFSVSLFLLATALVSAVPAGHAQQQQQGAAVANAAAAAASTITLYLKDGRSVPTAGLRREGRALMAKVKLDNGSDGEAGYDLTNITRVDFPDPGQLKIASDLLAQGRADDALKQLAPVLAYYAPFRDVPGSWWTTLAVTQLEAFNRLGRDAEADTVAAELGRLPGAPPDVLRAVKIRQGLSLERTGKHQEALAALEPVARDESAPPQTLSEAWLAMGSANLALGRNKAALLAYLHVPVYVPERALVMAPALLGSAVAYGRLNDNTRARESLQELVATYPNSREATEAKDRLRTLDGPKAKGKQNS